MTRSSEQGGDNKSFPEGYSINLLWDALEKEFKSVWLNKDSRNKFSKNIKILTEAKGITQQELAKRVGVKHSSISRLLSGKQKTSLRVLVLIARTLGVDERTLLRMDLPKALEKTISEFELTL